MKTTMSFRFLFLFIVSPSDTKERNVSKDLLDRKFIIFSFVINWTCHELHSTVTWEEIQSRTERSPSYTRQISIKNLNPIPTYVLHLHLEAMLCGLRAFSFHLTELLVSLLQFLLHVVNKTVVVSPSTQEVEEFASYEYISRTSEQQSFIDFHSNFLLTQSFLKEISFHSSFPQFYHRNDAPSPSHCSWQRRSI